jgi:hypothetical protein
VIEIKNDKENNGYPFLKERKTNLNINNLNGLN